jgi:hypothetical protein
MMTDFEFLKLLKTKCDLGEFEENTELVRASFTPNQPSVGMQLVIDSKHTLKCYLCDNIKPLVDFQIKDNKFTPGVDVRTYFTGYSCWDCWFNDLLIHVKFNTGEFPDDVISKYAYVASQAAKRNDWIEHANCFCGEIGEEFHHYDYRRPLQGRWLCKAHHNILHHHILDKLYVNENYWPEHLVKRYYIMVKNADVSNQGRIPKPEYEYELSCPRPLTRREIKDRLNKESFKIAHPDEFIYVRPDELFTSSYIQEKASQKHIHHIRYSIIKIGLRMKDVNRLLDVEETCKIGLDELQQDYILLLQSGLMTSELAKSISFTTDIYKKSSIEASKILKYKLRRTKR